ncbi:unnamed protein product [Pleuronectes platessa]|uniref:Uncharacterized protein n=1 Tax=Pleuronectes platessa TaxID=8262 RepID=A0A9N7V877_PLEPL|nr:unnamed protein product [Pleuronectes platessa]
MDNSDEPEDLLDGKIVFQKNKDRTFSKTKQYPPNHRNAKHVLVGEGRSSGMRQTRLTRRTHCAKEAVRLPTGCQRGSAQNLLVIACSLGLRCSQELQSVLTSLDDT